MKQFYVIEMNGYSEEESQEFLNHILHDVEWGKGQSLSLAHLNEKGVSNLKRYVFKEEVTE